MWHAYLTPWAVMHPHIIRFPPLNLTVPFTSWADNPFPGLFHTHLHLSEPRQLIFVSSDQMTRFQSYSVQCWCSNANSICCFICLGNNFGFFFFTNALNPACLRTWHTVVLLTFVPAVFLSSCAA